MQKECFDIYKNMDIKAFFFGIDFAIHIYIIFKEEDRNGIKKF